MKRKRAETQTAYQQRCRPPLSCSVDRGWLLDQEYWGQRLTGRPLNPWAEQAPSGRDARRSEPAADVWQATRLRVAFSEGDAGALQQLDFLSSDRETSVQPCLLRLVPKGSFRQLSLSGSWYHDERFLPHYVQVGFVGSLSQRGWSGRPPGVYFLFSLRDASLLEVTQVVPSERDQVIRLSNGCPT
jgi:hypothetical protein